MARPYSQDLRDRVVSLVASGRTCRATAALFGVSAEGIREGTARLGDLWATPSYLKATRLVSAELQQ